MKTWVAFPKTLASVRFFERLLVRWRVPCEAKQGAGLRKVATSIPPAAVFCMLVSAALAADLPQTGKQFQELERAERAYVFSPNNPKELNRRYESLLRNTRLRLEAAKAAHLSPEDRAVEATMAGSKESTQTDVGNTSAYRYDATLLTIAAGLESRIYNRGPKEIWETRLLTRPVGNNEDPYYTKDVPVHCRLGSPANKQLFILFNSSYSTWNRGSWTNKTVALLRAEFGDPHIVVFAGFLTPEFLGLRPSLPALSGELPANDLYPRIQNLLALFKSRQQIPADTQVGLVGFSGGANLVISLLAEDSKRIKSGSVAHPLFGRGGIAFSPILDFQTSFDVLDRSSRLLTERGFPPNQALTTPFVGNALFAALRGYGLSNPIPILEMALSTPEAKEKREDVIARFYREFEIVDLATTAGARYQSMDVGKAAPVASHRSYYVETVFPNYRRRFGLDPKLSFEAYTNIEPELGAIKAAPLYLVFALDDTVLARSALFPGEESSKRCAEVLQFARGVSSIRVFAPRYGAHLGYMLDRDFVSATFAGFFR